MEPVTSKVIVMVVLGLASFILGIIPRKIASILKWTRHGCEQSPISQVFISILLCFGAGVLLATSFVHMLPEVRNTIVELHVVSEDFPLSEVLVCVGLFTVYLIEELCHFALYRRTHLPHKHNPKDAHMCDSDQQVWLDGDARRRSVDSLLTHTTGLHTYGSVESLAVNGQLSHNPRTRKHDCQVTLAEHQHDHGCGTSTPQSNSNCVSQSNSNIRTNLAGGACEGPNMNMFRTILALLALAIHAGIEGLAIGLQKTTSDVFYLFGAVSIHKCVISFCLGMELSTGDTTTGFHVIYMAIFGGMSSAGIAVGLALTAPLEEAVESLPVAVLQAIAAGTLLYVTFFEILPRERAKCHAGVSQFLAVATGFAVMLAMETLVSHDHGTTHLEDGNVTTHH